jgi:hypothetical protein
LSDAAFRLHLSALDWCSEQGINTVSPLDLAAIPHVPINGKKRDAVFDELELARLWVSDGPVWTIDVPKVEEEPEPARVVSPELSAKRAEAGRKGGLARSKPSNLLEKREQKQSNLLQANQANLLEQNGANATDPSSPLELSSPDSSGFPSDSALLAASSLRSDPEPADSFSHVGAAKPKRRWRRVPAEWEPTDDHRSIARERGVDFELELSKFRDHEFATAKSDANGTFRNWLRNARPTVTALALPNRQAPGSNFERLRARADRMERERKEQEARNAAG